MTHIPFLLDTDSYKTGHSLMYPDNISSMTAYFTCRDALPEVRATDERIVFFGMRYLYDEILCRKITLQDIEEADAYLNHHGVQKSQFYWPKDLWLSVVEENNGFLPFKIEALRDGSVIHPQIPCFQITATGKYAKLVTWLETKMMRIWSSITTATKSRMVYDFLEKKFEETVDPEFYFLLNSRLHDFGSRGVSSAETAMTTGVAHLLSFDGTDTMIAGWLATKWDNGSPVGESVLATEHSVMTSYEYEFDAVKRLIEIAPVGSIVSCVADSYNYSNFLNRLRDIVDLCKEKNLFFVVRPDSGDPVECVIQGLNRLADAFGFHENSKGYKVINGAGIIQGDGIDMHSLMRIAAEVKEAGFSAQCVAYGMGGGLLQKQNRDTLKVAIKLCEIEQNGKIIPIMKSPNTDLRKSSIPGRTVVQRDASGYMIHPYEDGKPNALECIWDKGYTPYAFETFSEMRERLNKEWKLTAHRKFSFSKELLEKINTIASDIRKRVV